MWFQVSPKQMCHVIVIVVEMLKFHQSHTEISFFRQIVFFIVFNQNTHQVYLSNLIRSTYTISSPIFACEKISEFFVSFINETNKMLSYRR